MNKKKAMTLVASLGLVACIGVGATLAYFTDSDDALNTITMGHVDIELDEPTFSENNPENKISNVTPGQLITKDPTITVKAGSEASYLRAKIDIKGLSEEDAALIEESLDINRDLWVQGEDDYYYLQQAVGKTNVDLKFRLFDHVTIPTKWDNAYANAEFTINVTAEAIQADNFTPEKDNGVIVGWNNEEIQEYVAK